MLTALLLLILAPAAASAFVLARPTRDSPTPWFAETSGAVGAGATPWAWEPLPDKLAVALDGSQYGLVTCIGAAPIKTVYISIQGGGEFVPSRAEVSSQRDSLIMSGCPL